MELHGHQVLHHQVIINGEEYEEVEITDDDKEEN